MLKDFENRYCNCTEKHGIAPLCQKWSTNINKPFCILNGGPMSKTCPDAVPLEIQGKLVGDYFSSNASVCNKSTRKYFINETDDSISNTR